MRGRVLLCVFVVLAGCSAVGPDSTEQVRGDSPTTSVPSTQTATDALTQTRPPTKTGYRVTVTHVVDGDTIDVRWQNGTEERIRLLGVDTPEVHADVTPSEWEGVPDTEAGRDCLRAEGRDASAFAKRTLEGSEVRLTFDAEADHRGSYGRLLAYVHVDGRNVNYRLVADGYARVYASSFTELERFLTAEERAQAANRNAWRCQTTGSETTAGGPLAVVTVHADAAGRETENLDDEYVVFENTGAEPLDLSGWTVEDTASHAYTVPSNVTLDSGATLTLHTGRGTDTATDLYWGADGAVWNNGGDTVIVTSADGRFRLIHEYS